METVSDFTFLDSKITVDGDCSHGIKRCLGFPDSSVGIDYPLQVFSCGSAGNESFCNAGGPGLIPGLGRSTLEGKGSPLQNSGVNSMDCIGHRVTKSWTWLSGFHFTTSWKKSYEKPRQHVKKQRHYFTNKGPIIVKTMAFPVVVYGSESWIIKKAEHRRTDAFALCCWRRILRVPWTARRLNQSILKEISPEYSLEGLMVKLKLEYSGHLICRTDS